MAGNIQISSVLVVKERRKLDEILSCVRLQGQNKQSVEYSWFYSECVLKMVKAGVVMQKGLKERETLLECMSRVIS